MIELGWEQLVALALVLGLVGFVMWCFLKYGGDTITYYYKDEEQEKGGKQ